ncbi:prepilin peptidase [Candidatus Berkelbacteria bacterium]|nr:prepilin peptidase [Candidatus Berkelbacteria bacterium]
MDAIIFFIGLAVGSAVNAMVSRFDSLQSFVKGRSRCDHCGKTLTAYELIPVVSYLVQSGRCRRCRKPINPRYLLVELFSGLVFVALYHGSHPAQFVMSAAFFTVLLIASLIDIDTLTIPDSLLGIAAILAIINRLIVLPTSSMTVLYGVLFGVAIPALLFIPTRGKAMGFGDLKLGGVLGLWLGFPAVAIALWAAFCVGGLISLVLLITKRKRFGDEIAFGPYLVMGALIAEHYATKLIAYVTFS